MLCTRNEYTVCHATLLATRLEFDWIIPPEGVKKPTFQFYSTWTDSCWPLWWRVKTWKEGQKTAEPSSSPTVSDHRLKKKLKKSTSLILSLFAKLAFPPKESVTYCKVRDVLATFSLCPCWSQPFAKIQVVTSREQCMSLLFIYIVWKVVWVVRSSVLTKCVQGKTGFSLISMQKPTRIHGTIPRPVTLEVLWPTDREEFKFSVALRPQRPSGLLATGSLGRPPRLSHSPWSLCLCLSVSVSVSLSLSLSVSLSLSLSLSRLERERETDRQTDGRGGGGGDRWTRYVSVWALRGVSTSPIPHSKHGVTTSFFQLLP